jgi:hypothetical protein
MKIFEVADPVNPETGKLLALASFMQARAKDTGAQSQIDKNTFLKLAASMGVSLSNEQLSELSNQSPLNGVLLPVDPMSNVIKFKGDAPEAPGMPDPNQAQEIVANAAKSAMKKSRGV